MKQALAEALYDIGAIKVGEFTLASGKSSPVYIDLRAIISFPAILKQVAEVIWLNAKVTQTDFICGVPYTALPIATAIALAHDKPLLMVRKEAKTYGTKKLIEGVFKPGQSCLMIEDLVTTGGSAIKMADQLRAEGLHVEEVAVLIDREQGGSAQLQKAGYRLHAAFRVHELFSLLRFAKKLNAKEEQLVDIFLKTL